MALIKYPLILIRVLLLMMGSTELSSAWKDALFLEI
jgi:hypothetical protein